MRKALTLLALGLFCLGSAGCGTILSPAHWGRHIQKTGQEFHEFRLDIDRTIFGLEDEPIEKMPI